MIRGKVWRLCSVPFFLWIVKLSRAQTVTPYLNYSVTVPPTPTTTFDGCYGELECVDYNSRDHIDSNGHYVSDWMFGAIQTSFQYVTPQSVANHCTLSVWSKYSAWSRSTFSVVPISTRTDTYQTDDTRTTPLTTTTVIQSWNSFDFDNQPPCCGGCNLSVAFASLLYWPTPAPSPPVTRIVSGEQTFVSPTVYVRYSGIRAWDGCGYKTARLEEAYVGFNPSEISSVMEWVAPDVWATATGYPSFYTRKFITVPLDYSDLREPCGSTRTNSQNTQTLEVGITTVVDGSTYTDLDRCQPTLYIADVVSELAPGWGACKPVSYGVWDPPIALTTLGELAITQGLPVPSPVPDPQPEKTSHSQGMILTTSVTDPPASPNPAPAPSPGPPQPIQTQPANLSTEPAGTTRKADPVPDPPTGPTQPAQGQSDSPSDSTQLNQPTAASKPLPQDPANPTYLANPGNLPSKDPTTPKDPVISPTTSPTAAPAALAIGSTTITISVLPSGVGMVIGTHTLALNDPALTIADIPISLALPLPLGPSASASASASAFVSPLLIVGTSAINLLSLPLISHPPGFAAGSQAQTSLVPVTTDPTTLTLLAGGSAFKLAAGAPAVTMADGEIISAAGSSAVLVVSAGATKTEIVTALGSGEVGLGLGGVIWSMFGGIGVVSTETGLGTATATATAITGTGRPNANESAVTSFTGGVAKRGGIELRVWMWVVLGLGVLWSAV